MIFKAKQKFFDKTLRKTSRQYNREKLADMESTCYDDPKTFWETINSLEPRKSKAIPKIVRVDNNLVSDESKVCDKWQQDFEKLYKVKETNYNDEWLGEVCEQKQMLESEMYDKQYVSNGALNQDITKDEIEKAVVKLKNKIYQ